MEVKEMTVNITPLHDRVLVRRLEEKETAKGGIIIPDTAKEKPHEGEVIAIGAGKIEKGRRVPLDVKVGDRILFGKYTGNDINIDDQEYLILREEVRGAHHHQGRRDRCEGDRAARPAREHGCPNGARGCVQDFGCGWRWHHYCDCAGPSNLP